MRRVSIQLYQARCQTLLEIQEARILSAASYPRFGFYSTQSIPETPAWPHSGDVDTEIWRCAQFESERGPIQFHMQFFDGVYGSEEPFINTADGVAGFSLHASGE